MYGRSILGISSTFTVIALVLSIIAVVLSFIFIIPEKKRATLNKFGQFLHDTFNFKYLIVEKILQAFYILLTAYVVILGFFMLFYVQDSVFGSTWYGGYGFLLMIVGPIVVRLAYELLMMAILVVKNVISINNKLSAKGSYENDPFATPNFSGIKKVFQQSQQNDNQQHSVSPSQGQSAQNLICCKDCGHVVENGSFCTHCGTKF